MYRVYGNTCENVYNIIQDAKAVSAWFVHLWTHFLIYYFILFRSLIYFRCDQVKLYKMCNICTRHKKTKCATYAPGIEKQNVKLVENVTHPSSLLSRRHYKKSKEIVLPSIWWVVMDTSDVFPCTPISIGVCQSSPRLLFCLEL